MTAAAPRRGADRRASSFTRAVGRLFKPAMPNPLRPTGRVRFLLPAGRYAAPTLMASTVAQAVADERLHAVEEGAIRYRYGDCPRSSRVVRRRCGRAALEAGAASAVVQAGVRRHRVRTRVSHSARVRLRRMEHPAGVRLRFGPFSGIGIRTACELDAARGAGPHGRARARIAADLAREARRQPTPLAALEARRRGRRARGVRGRACSQYGPRSGVSRGATGGRVVRARGSRRHAVAANAVFDGALPLLERMPVSSSARSARDEGARPTTAVPYRSTGGRASACSCAALVLCDLDAGSYPVRLVEGRRHAASGEAGPQPPAERARRLPPPILPRAFRAPADGGVRARAEHRGCERRRIRPVMFEDCSTATGSGCGRGRPGRQGLPSRSSPSPCWQGGRAPRQPRARLRGGAATCVRQGGATLSWELSAARARCRPSSAPHRAAALAARGAARRQRRVSAVAVCAGKLQQMSLQIGSLCAVFACRRPDAGFRASRMGSFSHNVLRSFYEHFREAGHTRRWTPATLPEARALLDETFDRHLESNATSSARSTR